MQSAFYRPAGDGHQDHGDDQERVKLKRPGILGNLFNFSTFILPRRAQALKQNQIHKEKDQILVPNDLKTKLKCAIMELTEEQAEYVLWRLQCLKKENGISAT